MQKKYTWRYRLGKLLQPLFPKIPRKDRQPFFVGFLKQELDKESFFKFAQGLGFEPQSIAWSDHEETLGLRKIEAHDIRFQYHVRLFIDGEIRGHYEYTPEYAPFKHFYEIGFKDSSELLKVWFAPVLREDSGSTISHNAEAVSRTGPENG